ncbi:prolyl oligopeptidase family serine peptidase [Novosphingobium sp. BL-8H]|uniref:prolyl oligopeptidase family serine peptidase n=1 Tax=Novosphingobium sp. BL-8H TaxID=3127640 RepID=UPI003756E9D8
MAQSMNRREWLGASALAVTMTLVPARILAATKTVGLPRPPAARVAPVQDTYFGETLTDPYRWMENDKDPDWLPFLKAQNDYARGILDALPQRAGLLARIQQLSGDLTGTSEVQHAGGRLFYQQRPAGADNFKLFLQEAGKVRVLVDPTQMTGAGAEHFSLDWWRASPDGKRVVYGVSPNGSEASAAHILDVATGKNLPETIPNTEYALPQWLDDGSGFFYNQLTGKVDTPDRYLDSQARFHRIGSDPSTDPILMKRGLDPAVAFEKIQIPFVATAQGSSYALLGLADVRTEMRLYVAPLADVVAGKARWQEVTRFEDEVTAFDLHGDDLILLANKDHPRGRLVKTSAKAPSLAGAAEVVPQGPQVIDSIERAADGLYLKMMDGGVNRLRKLGNDGKVTEIPLPFDGTIGGLFTDPRQPGLLMTYGGWLTPPDVWSVDPSGKLAKTGMNPPPKIDVSGYATTRAFATARDGTQVPYALIYKKNLPRDGSAPAFIQAYGSYGAAAYTPSFLGKMLALVDAGAVVGFAYVRGGGEYGRDWHRAGQLANKPNTWRDLIDVCETLCRDKWTAPKHLAIGGRSAGGITVGRALTERPDLFAAVIDGVGWSNPLRYVVEQNGYGEEPEWGAISDPKGYQYIKAIDSYQHVVDGTPYPAVLLTTGITDPRVAPFHVGKMAARLQAASSSGKPILLRVDYDAGHGIGSTRSQQDREAADTYAFILWQTT